MTTHFFKQNRRQTKMTKHSKFKTKKKTKISIETATEQVIGFCERYDIDPEPEGGELNESLEAILEALVEYVSLGYLEFNEDFSITQHLQYPPGDVKEIKYNRINGKMKRAMDGFKATEQYGKIYALMGASSGMGDIIENLQGVDLKVLEGIGLTFLV